MNQTMKMTMTKIKTVKEHFTGFINAVYTGIPLSPEQYSVVQKVFYAGFLSAWHEISAIDNEDQAVQALQSLFDELKEFTITHKP